MAYSLGTASLLSLLPVFGGLLNMGFSASLMYTGLRVLYGMDVGEFVLTGILATVLTLFLYFAFAIGVTIILLVGLAIF